MKYGKSLRAGAVVLVGLSLASTAEGRSKRPVSRFDRLERLLKAQAARLDDQQRQIEVQRQEISSQASEIGLLRTRSDPRLGAPGAPVATAALTPQVPSAAEVGPNASQAPAGGPTLVAPVTQLAPVAQPVGEAPPDTKVEIAALPEEAGVLTPKGGWYVEPSFTYTRSSANVLVFRGVEIVTGVQVGLLQANSAARDTLVEAMDVRYGLTNRLEVEVRAPFVDRRDRIMSVAQRDQTVTQSQSLSADEIGDLEFSARYQLNDARPDRPIFILGATYKTDTGKGPFDVDYDQFGVASNLATGSGFQAIEPSISMLMASDPAVIYANLSYIHNFGRNIDKDIGGAHVGDVDPGDSVGAAMGLGFAVNPRFSFSLGYKHNYILPTYSYLNDTRQRSNVLQVGALTLGWSYALNSRIVLASSFEFGVTSDAPDLNLIFRLPIRF